jgi:hypothetical protein
MTPEGSETPIPADDEGRDTDASCNFKRILKERLREFDEDGGLTHEEVEQRLAKWLI